MDPAINYLESRYLAFEGRSPRGEVAAEGGVSDDERVTVHNMDGRLFVNQAHGRLYDVIIVNTPDPATVLFNRFYTRQFFARAKDALAPGGVVAFTCGEIENYVNRQLGRLLGCVSITLRESFSEQKLLPLGGVHFVASDSEGTLSADGAVLVRRLEERNIETSYMRDYYLGYDLSAERVEDLSAAVSAALAAESPRVNTDGGPVAQQYYLAYWYDLLGSRLASALEVTTWRGFPYLVPLAAILAFAATVVAGRGGRPRSSAAAVVAMGFSTLTAQVVILIALQTYRGHLYYSVGLVVAAFMVGLALGAALERRRDAVRSPALPQAALAWYCLAIGAALMSPVGRLPEFAFTPLAVMVSFAGGMAGGSVFQRASYVFRDEGSSGGGARGAGTLNACDHLGAALGALAAASILLPALGLSGTAAFAAAVAGGSAVGLLVFRG
jgi:spermidine synthase